MSVAAKGRFGDSGQEPISTGSHNRMK